MMSSTNGGFERRKVRLVLDDEFLSVYIPYKGSPLGLHWVPVIWSSDIRSFWVLGQFFGWSRFFYSENFWIYGQIPGYMVNFHGIFKPNPLQN